MKAHFVTQTEGGDPVDAVMRFHLYTTGAGTATRMTVEVREGMSDTYRHVILGRKVTNGASPKEASVDWGDESNLVFEDEVFTADEAAEVFAQYFDSLQVNETLTRRPL